MPSGAWTARGMSTGSHTAWSRNTAAASARYVAHSADPANKPRTGGGTNSSEARAKPKAATNSALVVGDSGSTLLPEARLATAVARISLPLSLTPSVVVYTVG